MANQIRHIVSLSGGKDSTALAIYMRDRLPEVEYIFCDTDKELPETYEYLQRLRYYLGKDIKHLKADRGFDHWLKVYGDYLPSSRMRWCTRMLKIKPFEDEIGDDEVILYVGIRADEDRSGYVSTKPNIKPVFPFKENGIDLNGVHKILEESGVGLPSYYDWRTRSGCYFCFYQRRAEWVGLKEKHEKLFEEAKKYEKSNPVTGERYTWNQRESLDELEKPERVAEIKERHLRALETKKKNRSNLPLIEVLGEVLDDENDDQSCHFCHV